MTAKEIVSRIPCACSDCGMYETKAMEMIAELLKEERNKAIDDVIRKLDSEYVERGDIVAPWKNIKYDIESLKSQ